MQCKDIPDRVFIQAIHETQGVGEDEDSWRMSWEVNATLNRLLKVTVPEKLFRAKAGNLLDKGLIEGCNCGCRGDYYLTSKGKELL